ncbi:UvrD-helicase domain-containing protein [Ferrimicrobium acidiphilum]|uniref:UvrD-helicase domain-containing protein n=1 Tax=Ferrimicrobium acidiphilum TaxID=121039 RepID=UPI0023F47418|nr:UvrD-helicase domain-containing protein [Ferrimicrobium acidiphilum]
MVKSNIEQQAILDAGVSGHNRILAINALAGTGKTNTLTLLAKGPLAKTNIHYITFNARAATDARKRFGSNTIASTAHSLAWQSRCPGTTSPMSAIFASRLVHGGLYGALVQVSENETRLRQSFTNVSRALRLDRSGWRGGISPVLQVIDEFTKSPDLEISTRHIPKPIQTLAKRMHATSHLDVLIREAQRLWERQIDPQSTMPVSHSVYLKLASLDPEPIDAEVVFFDEAQDASAPMLRILEAHAGRGGRLVLVGDKYQHIYGWAGAMNAIDELATKYPDESLVLPLCRSYRFGEDIADSGNVFLNAMGAGYSLIGMGPPGEAVGYADTTTVLFRSNLRLIMEILSLVKADPGVKFHVVGGTKDIGYMLNDLAGLFEGKLAKSGELCGFADWEELTEFSETPLGSGYRPLVNLVERMGGAVGGVLRVLNMNESNAKKAEVVLATAHKAKGAQWGSVTLSREFRNVWEASVSTHGDDVAYALPDHEEMALQYVAATRAETLLADSGLVPLVNEHLRLMRFGSTPEGARIMPKARRKSTHVGQPQDSHTTDVSDLANAKTNRYAGSLFDS